MPRNDLVLDLPVELTCEILCKWLLLKDVVQMDRAVCETALRTALLDHVYQSPLCIITDMPDLNEIIDWLAIRSLHVETLYICDSDAVYENTFEISGDTFRVFACMDLVVTRLIPYCQW